MPQLQLKAVAVAFTQDASITIFAQLLICDFYALKISTCTRYAIYTISVRSSALQAICTNSVCATHQVQVGAEDEGLALCGQRSIDVFVYELLDT